MAFWWVNHKQTRDHEVRGGYLWSPKRNTNNARNQSYENMTLVRPGDIVFSYAHGQLGAVGRVTEAANCGFHAKPGHSFTPCRATLSRDAGPRFHGKQGWYFIAGPVG